MIAQERLGHLDQMALATDRPAIDVRVLGGIELRSCAGMYVLGIDSANCSVLGRPHARAEGRLPFLEPGRERTTRIVVTAEEMK